MSRRDPSRHLVGDSGDAGPAAVGSYLLNAASAASAGTTLTVPFSRQRGGDFAAFRRLRSAPRATAPRSRPRNLASSLGFCGAGFLISVRESEKLPPCPAAFGSVLVPLLEITGNAGRLDDVVPRLAAGGTSDIGQSRFSDGGRIPATGDLPARRRAGRVSGCRARSRPASRAGAPGTARRLDEPGGAGCGRPAGLHPVAIWVLRRIRPRAGDRLRRLGGRDDRRSGSLCRVPGAALRSLPDRRRVLLASGMADRGSHLGERIEGLLRRRREFAPSASLVRVAGAVVLLAMLMVAGAGPRGGSLSRRILLPRRSPPQSAPMASPSGNCAAADRRQKGRPSRPRLRRPPPPSSRRSVAGIPRGRGCVRLWQPVGGRYCRAEDVRASPPST